MCLIGPWTQGLGLLPSLRFGGDVDTVKHTTMALGYGHEGRRTVGDDGWLWGDVVVREKGEAGRRKN